MSDQTEYRHAFLLASIWVLAAAGWCLVGSWLLLWCHSGVVVPVLSPMFIGLNGRRTHWACSDWWLLSVAERLGFLLSSPLTSRWLSGGGRRHRHQSWPSVCTAGRVPPLRPYERTFLPQSHHMSVLNPFVWFKPPWREKSTFWGGNWAATIGLVNHFTAPIRTRLLWSCSIFHPVFGYRRELQRWQRKHEGGAAGAAGAAAS